MSTFWIIVLIIFLVGGFGTFPVWQHSASYGYWPSGGFGLVFLVLLILLIAGKI